MNLIENQRAADAISGLYQDLEEQLMANLVRHASTYGQTIDSDEWLLQKLAEIGKLNKENMKIIAQAAGQSRTAMLRMLEDMAERVLKEQLEPGFAHLVREGLADAAVDAGKSKTVKSAMRNLQKQARDTLNLCNTTMLYKAQNAYKTLVQRTKDLEILNRNATAVVTGVQSRQAAMRQAIKEFNEKGIPAFVDKRGREWTPEAYVNMTMRNTARSVAEEVQSARCQDYGVDLISIDAHSGARPKCVKDQGKIFSLSNESGVTEDLRGRKIQYYPWSSSSYGDPDGILGINCGHHKRPFIPRVNVQRYFPTDDYDANDKLYKQTQVQRALERDVRKQKRECMLYDAADDKEAFEQAAVKLKTKEARLKQYVDGNDQLHRRSDREQVVGFDKGVSARAVAANKQHQKDAAGRVDEKQIAQKNQKAAENWAKRHLGVKKTNYTKQPVEVVNRTNRALQRVYRENPILQGFVDEIEFKDIDAVAQASIRIAKGQITTKMTFSPIKCTDEKQIQKMIDQEVASGFWTKKNGLYGIAKHEATHLSEYALALKKYGVDKATGGGDLAGAIKAIKSKEIAREIKKEALMNCNMADDYDTIKKNLCEYAAKEGAGEFLAEACSEASPRKLAKEVQRLFEKEMKK